MAAGRRELQAEGHTGSGSCFCPEPRSEPAADSAALGRRVGDWGQKEKLRVLRWLWWGTSPQLPPQATPLFSRSHPSAQGSPPAPFRMAQSQAQLSSGLAPVSAPHTCLWIQYLLPEVALLSPGR